MLPGVAARYVAPKVLSLDLGQNSIQRSRRRVGQRREILEFQIEEAFREIAEESSIQEETTDYQDGLVVLPWWIG